MIVHLLNCLQQLMHRNLIAMCQVLSQVNDIEHGKDSTIGFLPFYHIYGTQLVFATAAGGPDPMRERCGLASSVSVQKRNTGRHHGTIRTC